jgi:hypothetical protein
MHKVPYSETCIVNTQFESHTRTARPDARRQAIPATPALLSGFPPCTFKPNSRGLKPPVAY